MIDDQLRHVDALLNTVDQAGAVRKSYEYADAFQRARDAYSAHAIAPHPPYGGSPIWIGGDTLASVRRAARYGDGWLPFTWDLDAFRAGVSLIQELTRERPCPTMTNVFPFRIKKPDEPTTVRSTIPRGPKSFAGSADAIAQHVDPYQRAGLEYALCGFESGDLDDLLRQMRHFAGQVARQFADAG